MNEYLTQRYHTSHNIWTIEQSVEAVVQIIPLVVPYVNIPKYTNDRQCLTAITKCV